MQPAECARCRELLESASTEMVRHLRAMGRLDMARLRHESELIPSLEAVVRESGLARENAVAAYKFHRAAHGAKASTGG